MCEPATAGPKGLREPAAPLITESILLFGSHTHGTATDSSDIDLLIVTKSSERPIDRRIRAENALADREVTLDILVSTPSAAR